MFSSCVSGAIAGVMAPTAAAFIASGILGIGDVPEKVPEEPAPPKPVEDDSHPVPTLQGDPVAKNTNSDAETFTNPQVKNNSDDDFVYEDDDDDFFYETDTTPSASTSTKPAESAATAKSSGTETDLNSKFKPSAKGTDAASKTSSTDTTGAAKTAATSTTSTTTPVNTEKYTKKKIRVIFYF